MKLHIQNPCNAAKYQHAAVSVICNIYNINDVSRDLKMTEEKIGSLEEEAFKRKERLQALKRKNEESKENENDTAGCLPK